MLPKLSTKRRCFSSLTPRLAPLGRGSGVLDRLRAIEFDDVIGNCGAIRDGLDTAPSEILELPFVLDDSTLSHNGSWTG